MLANKPWGWRYSEKSQKKAVYGGNLSILSQYFLSCGAYEYFHHRLIKHSKQKTRSRCRDRFSSAIVPLRCDPQLFSFRWTTPFLCSDRVRQREGYLALSSLVQALSSFITELKQKDHRETTDPAAAPVSQAQREQLRLSLHSSRTYSDTFFTT